VGKGLFIWVEGGDDIRFFESVVIKPVFEQKYDWVRLITYSQKTKEEVNSYFRSIRAMDADYIFVADINDKPCVTAKKQDIQDTFRKAKIESIVVVVREIEGWYLAGLDDASSEELGVQPFLKTDTVTKEQFDSLIPRKFDSRIDFMLEVLKRFSIETARHKNGSFKYFAGKYNL
jgi:hypothetical protein